MDPEPDRRKKIVAARERLVFWIGIHDDPESALKDFARKQCDHWSYEIKALEMQHEHDPR